MKNLINFFNQQRAFRPLLVVLFLMFCNFILAQNQYNLVPNWSFENYTVCPSNLGIASPPPPWHLTTNKYGGVYMNACSTDPKFTVPVNTWGAFSYQYAHTGNGYLGGDFLHNPGINFGRTYIQTKLIDSLKNNRRYYVEFYVSLTNSSQYACNNVAMGLSKNAIWQDTLVNSWGVLSFNAQVYNYGNPVITDTMNWVKISAVYIAQGGEQFLTFGNFKKDNQTNYITVYPSVNTNRTSYYLDDVSVIPLDSFNLKADAGRDTTIHIGDSAFIGSLTNGIDSIKWQILNTNVTIDSIRPGFWVHPLANTCYVVTQTVNGFTSSDTVCVNVLPLPLKFTNYELRFMNGSGQFPSNGGVRGGFVENLWHTANEVNVSHFYVQRSLNGKDFTTIGKVKANGASYNEYSFIDNSLLSTVDSRPLTYYYRIVSVDRDGKTSFSNVKEITINNQQQTISIYPNPAKNYINVVGKNLKKIQLLDCFGRVVLQVDHPTERQIIDTRQLSKGMYFINITHTQTGKLQIQKLVIE